MTDQELKDYIKMREKEIAKQQSVEWKKLSSSKQITRLEQRNCALHIEHLNGHQDEIDKLKKIVGVK